MSTTLEGEERRGFFSPSASGDLSADILGEGGGVTWRFGGKVVKHTRVSQHISRSESRCVIQGQTGAPTW